jgi:hypothetical protein
MGLLAVGSAVGIGLDVAALLDAPRHPPPHPDPLLVFLTVAPFFGIGLLAILGGVLLLVRRFEIGTSRRPVHVWASPVGVVLDGRLAVPAEALLDGHAFVSDALSCEVVEIRRRRGPPLRLAVRDVGEGRGLLYALGLDASQRAVSFGAPSWAAVGFETVPAFILVSQLLFPIFAARQIDRDVIHALQGAAGGLLVGWVVLRCIPARIDVGFDGVTARWLGLRRFVAYAELRSADRVGGGRGSAVEVRLDLANGKTVRAPIPRWGSTPIVERIRQAKQTHDRAERLTRPA